MALVVFDLASTPPSHPDMPSAESIPKWIDFIREAGKKDIKVYVIGNKSDLDSEILAETRKLAEHLAEEQAEFYQEVSAKTNSNIEDLFNKVIDDLQATSSSKKKETLTITSTEAPQQLAAEKGTDKIKLGASSSSETGERSWTGCCQR